MSESFQSIIQKIPLALKNLKVENAKMVQNYIENLILSVLSDEVLVKRIKEDELDDIFREIKCL